MENIRLYLKESYNELIHHVTWPTWPELFSSAKLVIIATILFALVIFLYDLVSKSLTTALYSL
ncbi:MAG: preprotein translocase subunit SecE [Saprospiraceae bacterium]|nr:preprotein translocase subunit SecE [Saprospiraceae bacterium]MBK6565355.1 preprotein translocase subunit SecE [Saprospiraceae bacterium]MBK6784162.1 preprotein translocase subunit SecE [Saprospiraceae bacterium]MBK7522635.1 preprotein translocase subunit SecE [Saprospiraceae bacterium]MBK8080075.1 preprotein translocase subunit SecE [Saprospiraceae bacterium]